MAELKPCPFCGGHPNLIKSDADLTLGGIKNTQKIRVYWTVKCPRCFVKKEDVSLYSLTFDENIKVDRDGKKFVIEAWNWRGGNEVRKNG